MSEVVDGCTPQGSPMPHDRIACLCHVGRVAAVAWIAWAAAQVFSIWASPDNVARTYTHMVGHDLSGLPQSGYLAGLTIILVDVAISVWVVVCVWRLFGHYIRGNIFTVEAAQALRNLGLAGLFAVAADVAARPLISFALSLHLDLADRVVKPWAQPNDLLHALMAIFIVVLGHIFKTGAEMAQDHRQII